MLLSTWLVLDRRICILSFFSPPSPPCCSWYLVCLSCRLPPTPLFFDQCPISSNRFQKVPNLLPPLFYCNSTFVLFLHLFRFPPCVPLPFVVYHVCSVPAPLFPRPVRVGCCPRTPFLFFFFPQEVLQRASPPPTLLGFFLFPLPFHPSIPPNFRALHPHRLPARVYDSQLIFLLFPPLSDSPSPLTRSSVRRFLPPPRSLSPPTPWCFFSHFFFLTPGCFRESETAPPPPFFWFPPTTPFCFPVVPGVFFPPPQISQRSVFGFFMVGVSTYTPCPQFSFPYPKRYIPLFLGQCLSYSFYPPSFVFFCLSVFYLLPRCPILFTFQCRCTLLHPLSCDHQWPPPLFFLSPDAPQGHLTILRLSPCPVVSLYLLWVCLLPLSHIVIPPTPA